MAVKDMTILQLTGTPATVVSGSFDFVGFTVGWVYFLIDASDVRIGYSWAYLPIQKVIICPAGLPYPGDAALGNGGKLVTIYFNALPVVTMNRCENVDTSTGWVIITKGDFVIAYSPQVLAALDVRPST